MELQLLVQFAINTATSATTGFTPAKLTLGTELQMPIDMIDTTQRVPSVEQLSREMTTIINRVRENIAKTQTQQKIQADKYRRPHKFKEGDMILLDTRNRC